ncbi:crotonase [Artemisia annua]|uniref:Crotonase n=1 Tax=Artemisia annua TaxID=35608 RepID=A0A2U1N3J3_ARTAN|nr:crotonase [Artemisia annua]
MVQSLDRADKIGSQSEAQQMIEVVRQKFLENGPLHPACLDIVKEGIVYGGHLGEADDFNRLVVSEAAKGHLINVFFSQHATSKPRAIKKGIVIDEGFM